MLNLSRGCASFTFDLKQHKQEKYRIKELASKLANLIRLD